MRHRSVTLYPDAWLGTTQESDHASRFSLSSLSLIISIENSHSQILSSALGRMTAVFRVPRQPNQLAEYPNLGRWFLPSCLYFQHIIALTTTPITNVRSAPSKIFAKKTRPARSLYSRRLLCFLPAPTPLATPPGSRNLACT